MDEWQLIATAPKDGRQILGFEHPFGMRVIQWGSQWTSIVDNRWNDGEYDFAPTHWMPLPDPPTKADA